MQPASGSPPRSSTFSVLGGVLLFFGRLFDSSSSSASSAKELRDRAAFGPKGFTPQCLLFALMSASHSRVLASCDRAHESAGEHGGCYGRSSTDHVEMFGARPGMGGYKRSAGTCSHLSNAQFWWQGPDARARAQVRYSQAFRTNATALLRSGRAVEGWKDGNSPERSGTASNAWDGIAPARGDNCEARSHRSYVRQDVEYPRGLVSVQRPTVGRRNITQFTVAKPQSSCAPDSDALRCARDGAMIYQSVAQRIPPKVGSEPLPPPPPAGSAPALLPRGFRHSEVTSFTEHMRRNPTFRGASALDFYTSGRVI